MSNLAFNESVSLCSDLPEWKALAEHVGEMGKHHLKVPRLRARSGAQALTAAVTLGRT